MSGYLELLLKLSCPCLSHRVMCRVLCCVRLSWRRCVHVRSRSSGTGSSSSSRRRRQLQQQPGPVTQQELGPLGGLLLLVMGLVVVVMTMRLRSS